MEPDDEDDESDPDDSVALEEELSVTPSLAHPMLHFNLEKKSFKFPKADVNQRDVSSRRGFIEPRHPISGRHRFQMREIIKPNQARGESTSPWCRIRG